MPSYPALKKIAIRSLILSLVLMGLYGVGRLYFHLTGGFMLANIQSDFSYQPDWEVRPLEQAEKRTLKEALDQPYSYLGKGCQSYVFISEDKEFVIKFFKYQRFRLQTWLAYFPSLPAIVKYRQEKIEKKQKKLDGFMKSWKTAFEHLKKETGLVFVHLNKTNDLYSSLKIIDKIGQPSVVPLDNMEFCVQRRADMLCPTLLDYKTRGDLAKAQAVIRELLQLIVSEYQRGLADNDHALMQNTGIVQGRPVHIDVGQFVLNEKVKEPAVYHQELVSKTYKFKLWLRKAYPELANFLEDELTAIIGPSYSSIKPVVRKR